MLWGRCGPARRLSRASTPTSGIWSDAAARHPRLDNSSQLKKARLGHGQPLDGHRSRAGKDPDARASPRQYSRLSSTLISFRKVGYWAGVVPTKVVLHDHKEDYGLIIEATPLGQMHGRVSLLHPRARRVGRLCGQVRRYTRDRRFPLQSYNGLAHQQPTSIMCAPP